MRLRYSIIAALAPLSVLAASAQTASEPPVLSQQGCAVLKTYTVAPAAIGLPTSGARVTAAQSVAATAAAPAHCLVSGEIAPVDLSAPPIRFQIALPIAWNGKMIGMGGGGFNGTIPPVTFYKNLSTAASPLMRGYAVFGSDSGHKDNPAAPGDFMTNKESLDNYLGAALKKTHDTALAIVRTVYGRNPSRTYFIGGSTGGREALWVGGRWPQDWDGVIAYYPARALVSQVIGGLPVNRAFAEPGAFVPPIKRKLLLDAAMDACDGLDGAKDGLISDVRSCNARFVPARAKYRGKSLRCVGGTDTGDDCLSDAQLKALAVMQASRRIPFSFAVGASEFPGYNAYTSDAGISSVTPADKGMQFVGLGALQPGYPFKPGMTLGVLYGDNFVRYGIAEGAPVNPITFDPANSGKYLARLSELSRFDASDLNLRQFAARGGKLLITHGLADLVISPRFSEGYVDMLRKRMGAKRVASFLRLYEIPGFSHGMSNTFNARWDSLTALERWVEKGQAPTADEEIVTDITGVPGRTRPLCSYPSFPKYRGSGDVNSASSFTCAPYRR
jgi:hypothetical protein